MNFLHGKAMFASSGRCNVDKLQEPVENKYLITKLVLKTTPTTTLLQSYSLM